MLATRLKALRPTTVNTVLAELRRLQQAGKKLVSLMRGQPDTPTPEHIVAAAERALRAGRTGYPDNRGELGLRNAIAEKLLRDQQLRYDPEREILVTDGATCGINAALAALINPGDGVLLPSPIYDAYQSPIALWGGHCVPIPASVKEGRFIINDAALAQACTPQSRVLLINTPWNPVGTALGRGELADIMQAAHERDLWVISDEIYETLLYDGRSHISPAALSGDARQRTIVVNSMSKTYAMTGWRVGFCAGPAEVIDAMLLILQQSSRGPATFVQDAAECALRADQACVHAMTAEYQQRRERVVEALQGIPGVSALVPEGGLFVMADIRGLQRSSDEVRKSLLEGVGVVVIHGAAFGPEAEGTLRVSFAAGGSTLEQGLARLREGLLRLAHS